MRLLFVCPTYPLPLDTGSRVRWVNLARQLVRLGHTVDVLCFATAEEERAGAQADAPFGRIETVRTGAGKDPVSLPDKISRAASVALARLRGLPRFMAYAAHPGFRRRLSALAPAYDTVFIEMFFMAANLDGKLLRAHPDKFVLVEHDISFIPFRRHHEVCTFAPNPFARLRAWHQYRAVRAAELDVLSRFRRVIAMSALDADLLADLAPGAEILLAPNGVDSDAIAPRDNARPRTDPELLYVGGLHHRPNRDAILHFLRDILPVLDRTVPGAHLTVLGTTGGLDRELAALAPGRVRFAGFVPDAAPYYDRCLALAVPLRVGGGTRLKILEAMAAGVPVITTTVGAEGIDVADGETVLMADTPETFARAVARLLDDPAEGTRLARAGRALCERTYDWGAIAADLAARLAPSPRKDQ